MGDSTVNDLALPNSDFRQAQEPCRKQAITARLSNVENSLSEMNLVGLPQHIFQAQAVAYVPLRQNNQLDNMLGYLFNSGTTKWFLSNALM